MRPKIQPLIFFYKDFLYSAWIVIFFATHVMFNIKSLQDGAPQWCECWFINHMNTSSLYLP